MRSRIASAGALFLGIAFALTDVAAQSEPGFIFCETQNQFPDYTLDFILTYDPIYVNNVAAVVLPVYAGGQSISPIYLLGDGNSSDGCEHTILDKFRPGTAPEDNCELQGVWVWMEHGDWYTDSLGRHCWQTYGE